MKGEGGVVEIKVTSICGRFHARLFADDGTILDEMACSLKRDIGWIYREMLRWQDKLGNSNEQTKSARRRQSLSPIGKVWYRAQLEKEGLI